ncbi:MAG: CoA-binding protein, partial [Acidimicrobiales bacterium]
MLTDTDPPEHRGSVAAARPTGLAAVFEPRRVALVGASDQPGKMGELFWRNLSNFPGEVVPVTASAASVDGRTAYPSLGDVDGEIDLAVVVVPAPAVPGVLRDAAAKGVRAVVVISGGFAETGPEGVALQQRLVEAGRGAGVRVIGPNCQGVLYTPSRLFATFSGAGERPLVGSSGIGYVGQSGAVGGSVLDLAAERGLDLTAWVSTGNEAVVE